MSAKWPLSFEQVRGHWIALLFAFLGACWRVFWQIEESGLASLFHVGPIVVIFLYSFLAYWFWRAIDYTGWRVMSRYLPRK